MAQDNIPRLLECLDTIELRELPRGEMSVRISNLEDASRMTPLDYCP
jgi:hypothetical protein